MSYTMLAEYLSVDRSAMMRELKNMVEEGVLQREGKKICLFVTHILQNPFSKYVLRLIIGNFFLRQLILLQGYDYFALAGIDQSVLL